MSELTPSGEPKAKSINKPTTHAVPIFSLCGTAKDQYINTSNTQSGLKGSNEKGNGINAIIKAKNMLRAINNE
ncbi:hypothetical protein PES01_00290 [Pseudoalteromonas espejiana]|uniref:Uncharacterized protein n=1 Tax=Pseudoalteromonas espejiana TaxID=28107 RepID=A0A510XQ74_9GAMM|nr:hypothetical protein PES01_00290 [Pseudoalteromonas espejiana]